MLATWRPRPRRPRPRTLRPRAARLLYAGGAAGVVVAAVAVCAFVLFGRKPSNDPQSAPAANAAAAASGRQTLPPPNQEDRGADQIQRPSQSAHIGPGLQPSPSNAVVDAPTAVNQAQVQPANAAGPALSGRVDVVPGASSPKAGVPTAPTAKQIVSEATAYIKVRTGRMEAFGSGFVISTEGDEVLVATNDHVINPDHGLPMQGNDRRRPREAPVITVVFRSGGDAAVEQSLAGTVVAAEGDENHDLAVLRVRGVQKPPQPLKPSMISLPEATTPVLIYGFPFGNIDKMVNRGVQGNPSVKVNRSSISGTLKDRFGQVSHVQFNGGIDPGNSGGPVVDEKTGELVGVAVAKISNSSIGFAIPAAELVRMLAGRLGPPRLAMNGERQGQVELAVELPLIDPLNQVKSAELRYTPTGAKPALARPEPDGSWPPLPGATSVSLTLDESTAAAKFQAP